MTHNPYPWRLILIGGVCALVALWIIGLTRQFPYIDCVSALERDGVPRTADEYYAAKRECAIKVYGPDSHWVKDTAVIPPIQQSGTRY